MCSYQLNFFYFNQIHYYIKMFDYMLHLFDFCVEVQAHSLLKASLISPTALTHGLGPFLATK